MLKANRLWNHDGFTEAEIASAAILRLRCRTGGGRNQLRECTSCHPQPYSSKSHRLPPVRFLDPVLVGGAVGPRESYARVPSRGLRSAIRGHWAQRRLPLRLNYMARWNLYSILYRQSSLRIIVSTFFQQFPPFHRWELLESPPIP